MPKRIPRTSRKQKVKDRKRPTPKYIKSIEVRPKTDKQQQYLNALKTHPLVFSLGCAGTGKTYIAATYACKLYNERRIERIVVTRPNVAAGGATLGHFPGTKDEKMLNWMGPVVNVLDKHLGSQKVRAMIAAKELVFEPFETMRGASYTDAFVLLDEAQNATFQQLEMFLTRLGDNTVTVVDGDCAQFDLEQSGLAKVVSIIQSQDLDFPIIDFTECDIVRSDVCATWIRAFNRERMMQA